MRPKLLDLFCGQGGAGMGYHRAGFDVVGVDITPQPRYPFEFVQADALAYAAEHWHEFDAIHASPPCQAYTLAAGTGRRRTDHVELVDETRELLRTTELPFVIENVPQAPLRDPITLCGTQFGLPIIRHRSFEANFLIVEPRSCGYRPTARCRHKDYVAYPYARGTWEPAWRQYVLPVIWPWMTVKGAGQAIPPAYTEYIGQQLLASVHNVRQEAA